jgi:hypothetical protein
MSISEIVSIASSNVEFYESFQNKDFYYEKIIDKTILLSSEIREQLERIVHIDFEIGVRNEYIKSIEKNISSLQKDLHYDSHILFIMVTHCIKINRQMRREIIDIIHSLNNLKNDIYKGMQNTEDFIKPSFSTNITITESNKLRGILRNEKNQSYLMNMTNESRNKRKNSREMNKLLFGKEKSSNKHNKIRKTHSPNNKLYY